MISASANKLLNRLSREDLDLLGALEPVDLPLGQNVERIGEAVTHIYFFESGLCSVVCHLAGASAEVGLVGFDGFVGAGILVGDTVASFDCMAQVAGAAQRVEAAVFANACRASPSLNLLMHRFAHTFTVQVAYTAWSNGRGLLEQRLARWLLMVANRAGVSFEVTHQFLSMMLAVRRSGVTAAVQALEGRGLIKATRGHITILDRKGMELAAAPAYGPAEAEYARIMNLPI